MNQILSNKAIQIALTEISSKLIGKSICQVADEALDYVAKKIAKHIVDLETTKE